jgi:hypothetical protein
MMHGRHSPPVVTSTEDIMTDLIAKKSMTYATRRLLPGDPFVARTRADARALIAIGKAESPDGDDGDQKEEMDDLRAEYVKVVGKRPFHGWDAAILKDKIAEAKEAKAD